MMEGLRAVMLWVAVGWLAALGQGKPGRPASADSGWVPLFNGRDFGGLYIRSAGGALQYPNNQQTFQVRDSALYVPASGGIGHIATQAVYSRYHVRVQYRYGKGQANPNAGLLYHIPPEDWSAADVVGTRNAAVPYFHRAYMKSVELQMYRGDAGAFLGIMNVWVTAETRGDANHTYQAGGTPYTAHPSNDLSPRRIYRSHDAAPNDTDWVQMEGLVYGADSVVHRVNGSVVMRGRNLLHHGKTTVNPDTAGRTPMERGRIGLQAEGAEVFYRNWEIRLLRKDGTPIIPGCTNPSARNYSPLANEDDGSCQAVSVARNHPPGKTRGGPGLSRGGARPALDALGRRHARAVRAITRR